MDGLTYGDEMEEKGAREGENRLGGSSLMAKARM